MAKFREEQLQKLNEKAQKKFSGNKKAKRIKNKGSDEESFSQISSKEEEEKDFEFEDRQSGDEELNKQLDEDLNDGGDLEDLEKQLRKKLKKIEKKEKRDKKKKRRLKRNHDEMEEIAAQGDSEIKEAEIGGGNEIVENKEVGDSEMKEPEVNDVEEPQMED